MLLRGSGLGGICIHPDAFFTNISSSMSYKAGYPYLLFLMLGFSFVGCGTSLASFVTGVLLGKVVVMLTFVLMLVGCLSCLSFIEWEEVGVLADIYSFIMGKKIDLFSYFCLSVPIVSSVFVLSFTVNCISLTSSFLEISFFIHLIGFQWGWEFYYPFFDIDFMYGLDEDGFVEGLDIFSPSFVFPVKTSCTVVLSSLDVIHSLGADVLGVKLDAVPGHLNSVFFDSEVEGFTGVVCSEYCGEGHSFMSLKMDIVSYMDFFVLGYNVLGEEGEGFFVLL
uniref:cytochrome c oxidase subunit II n=1 Tax=Sphaeromyxa zaharoni TaxID=275449 RepID=UPI00300151D2